MSLVPLKLSFSPLSSIIGCLHLTVTLILIDYTAEKFKIKPNVFLDAINWIFIFVFIFVFIFIFIFFGEGYIEFGFSKLTRQNTWVIPLRRKTVVKLQLKCHTNEIIF